MYPINRYSRRNISIIIFAIVSFFIVLGATNLNSPFLQIPTTSTPTTLLATPTKVATPFSIETEMPTVQDGPTNKDLLDHFEKVTSLMLTVTTIVITALGVFGGLGLYYGKSTFNELSTQVEKLQSSISEMEITQGKLKSELTRAEGISQTLLNRYRYLVECQDSQPSVRLRAIQHLSASNDISVISLMSEMLIEDDNAEVRAEAAFALSTLLINSSVENGGIDALISALNDRNLDVKLQAIQALDNLICNRAKLPRKAYVRLEKLSSSRPANKITEASKLALKHKQQAVEGNLANNTEHNQSKLN